MARNTQKRGKREMHTIGPGMRAENLKTFKMFHKHLKALINVKKKKKKKKKTLKNVQNEKHTL